MTPRTVKRRLFEPELSTDQSVSGYGPGESRLAYRLLNSHKSCNCPCNNCHASKMDWSARRPASSLAFAHRWTARSAFCSRAWTKVSNCRRSRRRRRTVPAHRAATTTQHSMRFATTSWRSSTSMDGWRRPIDVRFSTLPGLLRSDSAQGLAWWRSPFRFGKKSMQQQVGRRCGFNM